MKPSVALALSLATLSLAAVSPVNASEKPGNSEALAEIGRAHEQVAKGLASDHTTVVIQKGDKQFTIYGVVSVRAIGPVMEITVKNGEKYSVSAGDIFFITNNGFKM